MTEKVQKHHHNQVSTFGIGGELSRDRWMHLAQQLEGRGLLEQTEHHGLRLSEAGRVFLRQRQSFFAALPPERAAPVEALPLIEAFPHDQTLLNILFEFRRELAQRRRVPAYVIFPDRTLVEMATFYPQSLASLHRLHGVGDVKLETFGRLFLDMIVPYCKEKRLAEKPYTPGAAARAAPRR
jgi:ATP-dependent DNA helicase RecQ